MDLRTVVVWNGLFFISLALLLWILYFTIKPRQISLRCWAAAYSSVVAGAACIALRGMIPDVLSIVFGNIFLTLPLLLLIQGIRTLRGEVPRLKILVVVSTICAAWLTWFSVVHDDTAIRALFFSGLIVGLSSALAVEVLRPGSDEPSGIRKLIAGLAVAFGLTYLIRFILIVLNGIPHDLMAAGFWDALVQALAAMILGSLALPLIFLIVARLNGELTAALNERELLLREMTHRIKNDLSLVDSLISLQQVSEIDERYAKTLGSLRERIGSIAAAHDQFSRHTGDIGKIDLRAYFEVIADALPSSSNIKIERRFDNVEAPFKTALHLGLLLNELATNAIKYAFPNNRSGTIKLTFTVKETHGSLEVSDDGTGTTWPPENDVGLGATIIDSMTKALKGKLSYTNDGGSRFKVEAPIQTMKAKSL